MVDHPGISFDNTEFAFEYKSDKELRKARWLFSSMGYSWLVKMGTWWTPKLLNLGVPIKGLIRSTIFEQFVGGETLEQTKPVVERLNKYHVQAILDYGVEGKEEESDFDQACEGFIEVIDYAATQPNIPFMSIKVTGFASNHLLEKLHLIMQEAKGTLMKRFLSAIDSLTPEEKEAWHRVRHRMMRICERAAELNVGVLVDAEETWIQDPVDALTMLMMDMFNKEKGTLFNTIQLYRHDRLKFLHDCYAAAEERKFILGVKLVRGAYMEKERARAEQMGYPSPIQPNKETCDKDYNTAMHFCLDHLKRIFVVIASHNEYSNLYAVVLMHQRGIPFSHPHVHFSQLYGMSDNISFNLAHAGCAVSKYLPFGPINDVIPYLMRRAQENSSVSGQTSRELSLIESELQRRRARG